VIGAGPAGLTAALELTKAGRFPLVLEADSQVGGISQTVERDGWRFDIGGHRFFTKVSRVQAFWEEVLGPDSFLVRQRVSRIYYEGKFFSYPIKPLDALTKLGPIEAARCVASYVSVRLRPPADQADLESWVAARFGWRLYRMFFKTYTEKVWGVPASTIRSDWAAQRIKSLSLPSAVLHAITSRLATTRHTSLIERFQYPRLGPGMMWERTAELVEEAGGEVLLGQKVVALHRDSTGVVDVVVKDDAGRRRVPVREVISSMPLGELVLALDPVPPGDVIDAAKALTHRDFLTVALVVPEEAAFPDNWIYIHDPGVKLGRVQNFRSWSPDMVKTGKTCLGLEYFVFEGDALWAMDDADLLEFATEEIERIGLIPKGIVEAGYVVRIPKAYPVYDSGYAERIETLREWMQHEVPNVYPVGRNGMHRYNNQDHSMLTAMLAVENILGGNHNVWAVNVEADYHESGSYTRNPGSELVAMSGAETGRAVPTLLQGKPGDDRTELTRGPNPKRRLIDWLVSLSTRSPLLRSALRMVFRLALDQRRRARSFLRLLFFERWRKGATVEWVGKVFLRFAFRFSTVGWLRATHFRLRDLIGRRRRRDVAVEQLLVGGWNGMSAKRFAKATGNLLEPSTRLVDSAQVELLRRFDGVGEKLYEADRLGDTPYVQHVRAAAELSGHHRGARTEEEFLEVAREFLDRYRGRVIPYRPGRTTDGALPRVRRIRQSECFEVMDGHHRLAIEIARGESEVEVVVERLRSSTPVQDLLRQMSWLDGQVRLYQPIPLPEVATWPLMRRCTDRLGLMIEFLAGRGLDGSSFGGDRSYLDVGACYGWFVAQMGALGFDAHGIEQDPLAGQLAELVYGLEPGRLVVGDFTSPLAPLTRRFTVVSCFSMLHHFVLGRGQCPAEELVARLDAATDEVLFLDTGEHHESWFRLVLPEWTPRFARQWLLDNTTFSEVRALGTDRDDKAPFEGKFGRTLFACSR